MTERKPPGISFESWVDKQVREAEEQGKFENLPGIGKPLPGQGKPYVEDWWITEKVRREGLSADELLPTPVRLRKEISRLPDTIRELPTESAVRAVVEDLNQRIRDWWRAPSDLSIVVPLVAAEDIVRQWQANRPAPTTEAEARTEAETRAHIDVPGSPKPRTRWWRRFGNRRVRT